MRMTCKILVAAIGAAVMGVSAANADPIIYTDSTSLANLVAGKANGDAIVVGDKIFYNFGYSTTGLDMPSSGNVEVKPITDAFGNYGIQFHGLFQDLPGGEGSDALITYEVLVLDQAFKISDAHIQGDPSVFGTGYLTVTETWLPDVDQAQIRVYDIRPGDMDLADSIVFPNTYSHLFVQKDIAALVRDETGVANMSFVDQTFSQVPEPASLGLLALGGATLLFRRRK